MHSDPHGQLALRFFLDAFMGTGEKRNYRNNSRFANALKKSTAVLNEFEKRRRILDASGATQMLCKSSISLYENETANDKDLSLTVGQADYMMQITKETRTIGILRWKKEQTRYVAEVKMWDSYDFTEWFPGRSFGAVMNNIAAIGQFVGVIIPYDWEVNFTIKTKWE